MTSLINQSISYPQKIGNHGNHDSLIHRNILLIETLLFRPPAECCPLFLHPCIRRSSTVEDIVEQQQFYCMCYDYSHDDFTCECCYYLCFLFDAAELKMDVLREREVKENLERQLLEEQKIRGK